MLLNLKDINNLLGGRLGTEFTPVKELTLKERKHKKVRNRMQKLSRKHSRGKK